MMDAGDWEQRHRQMRGRLLPWSMDIGRRRDNAGVRMSGRIEWR